MSCQGGQIFQNSADMKTTTSQLRNSINHSLVRTFLLIAPTLGWLAFSPQARGVCQDACLTNSNTVQGENALLNNTGMSNTAIGASALLGNTTGGFNTANGNQALQNNATGSNNTANGNQALLSNTSGNSNTGVGGGALLFNTEGHDNTAIGASALQNNTNGNNTAIGFGALMNNTTGHDNIALGFKAGIRNVMGNYNIDIGTPGLSQEFKTIRIGEVGKHLATFIAGISGAPVADGVGVLVGSDGKLGTIVSSARFKEAVKPMDKASEAILALKPVTFHYKHEIDPASIPQFGLVAEDVEKVNPDLVARDEQGKPYSVRYEAVNAMLLNEFLKEHGKVEKLEATIADQQKQIQALTATVQKVSAQIEMSRPAPQTVVDNH
jgi:trimeric autotransporter adhesin